MAIAVTKGHFLSEHYSGRTRTFQFRMAKTKLRHRNGVSLSFILRKNTTARERPLLPRSEATFAAGQIFISTKTSNQKLSLPPN